MTTKQIQHLLAYFGYDVEPDGIYGAQTKTATGQFQADRGDLDPDGIPGQMTQAALIQALGSGWQRPMQQQADTFWDEIEYFRKDEFRCPCGRCGGFPVEPAEATVRAIDEIRRRLGVPVMVTSGIRCIQHNAEAGGVSNSQHLTGLAADLHSSASPQQMQAVAEAVLGNTGGIGLYSWGIHVDTRKTKARWKG